MQTVHHHAWLSDTAATKDYPVPAIIRAVYYTSKVMGAAPYNISPSGVVSDSREWIWYSRFFQIFFGILNVLQAIFFDLSVDDTPPGISRILFFFDSGSYSARSISIQLSILTLLHSRLKTLINYWRENSDLPPKDKRKLLIYTQCIASYALCWIVMFALNITNESADTGKRSIRRVAEVFSNTINEMSLIMVEVQFTCCILVLRKQFMYINNQLTRQIDLLAKDEDFAVKGNGRQNLTKQLPNNWWMPSNIRAFQDNCTVSALRSHHAFLIGVSEDVNNLYTIPILTYIAHCTAHAIISSFAVVAHTPRSVNRASWAFVYMLRLAIVMVACHCTTSQADHTAKLVHEALNEDTLTMEERKEILSTVTTYLVIMMQFQLSFDGSNSKRL